MKRIIPSLDFQVMIVLGLHAMPPMLGIGCYVETTNKMEKRNKPTLFFLYSFCFFFLLTQLKNTP